jgi:hypothetical protein
MPCVKLVDNKSHNNLVNVLFLVGFTLKCVGNLIWLIINSIPTHKSNHLLMHGHPHQYQFHIIICVECIFK